MTHLALIAFFVLLGVLPLLVDSYVTVLLTHAFFFAFLAQSWNIVGGYAGLLSFGHAAFVGLAAYATAMLAIKLGVNPWLGMFVGAMLSGGLGTVVGYLAFRFGLRGFYFALLTVAVAEIARVLALNSEWIGGGAGLFITYTGNPAEFQFTDPRAYCYVAFVLMSVVTLIVAIMERTRFGSYLVAIKEDEEAAEALGIDTFRCKMLASALSAFLTGLGGAFYAYQNFSLQPDTVFGLPLSVEIVTRAIIGGVGTLAGPILGSLILSPIAEVSREFFAESGRPGAHLIVYGLLLIVVTLFLPGGAMAFLRRLRGRVFGA